MCMSGMTLRRPIIERMEMGERECITNYLPLPARSAQDIAIAFTPELLADASVQLGIARRPDCDHYIVFARTGQREIHSLQCWKKRKDAEAYCSKIGEEFGPTCETLFGVGTIRFSSN